jgi:Rrf2 family cysteine metabolism transcriptional repressor
MNISKKCQYALRAILELAWRNNGQPVKIHKIARAQGISPRFTEIIMNDLKHAGFVESKRGKEGGYMLAREAKDLTVGEVIEYIQGPIALDPDDSKTSGNKTFLGREAFKEFWKEVNNAIIDVCETKTFANLMDYEESKRKRCAPNYSI